MAGIFKGLPSAERLCKDAFLVTIFTEDLWAVSQTGEKKSMFSNKNGYVCKGPELLHVCEWGSELPKFCFI